MDDFEKKKKDGLRLGRRDLLLHGRPVTHPPVTLGAPDGAVSDGQQRRKVMEGSSPLTHFAAGQHRADSAQAVISKLRTRAPS